MAYHLMETCVLYTSYTPQLPIHRVRVWGEKNTLQLKGVVHMDNVPTVLQNLILQYVGDTIKRLEIHDCDPSNKTIMLMDADGRFGYSVNSHCIIWKELIWSRCSYAPGLKNYEDRTPFTVQRVLELLISDKVLPLVQEFTLLGVDPNDQPLQVIYRIAYNRQQSNEDSTTTRVTIRNYLNVLRELYSNYEYLSYYDAYQAFVRNDHPVRSICFFSRSLEGCGNYGDGVHTMTARKNAKQK